MSSVAYRVNRPRSKTPSSAQRGWDYRTLSDASPALKAVIRRSERFDKKASRHNTGSNKYDAVLKNMYRKSDEAMSAARKLAEKEGVRISQPKGGGRANVMNPHKTTYKERKEAKALRRK